MLAVTDCDIANITMVDTFEKAVYRTLEEVDLPNFKRNGIVFRYKNDILILSDSFLIVKMENRNFDFVGLPRHSEMPETDIRYQFQITHTGKPKHLTKDWEGSNISEQSKVIKIGEEANSNDNSVVGQDNKETILQIAPSIKKDKVNPNTSRNFPSPTPEPGTTRTGYERIFDMDYEDPWAKTREITDPQSNEVQPQSISNYNQSNSRAPRLFSSDLKDAIRDDKVEPKVAITLKVIQETSKDSNSIRILELIKDKLVDLSFDNDNIFISLKGDDNLVKIGLLKSGKFRFTTDDWGHLKAYEKFK